MSAMSGNKDYLCALQESDDASALVSATLAVAYEQRTANLLHAFELSLRSQSAGFDVEAKAIDARLGLNEGATE